MLHTLSRHFWKWYILPFYLEKTIPDFQKVMFSDFFVILTKNRKILLKWYHFFQLKKQNDAANNVSFESKIIWRFHINQNLQIYWKHINRSMNAYKIQDHVTFDEKIKIKVKIGSFFQK